MESMIKFVKIVIGDTTHVILKEPMAHDLKTAVERMQTIYTDRVIDVEPATRAEWGLWHGFRVVAS